MKDANDISGLLASWPYDPEQDARIVRGRNGHEILQVRLPLGIEQYELKGRPDGLRPHGFESEFDYQLDRFEAARRAGDEDAFALGPDDCAELFREGTLYYYRYLHLFQLQNWHRTVRDTARNLRLFDFVREHARSEDDQLYLEKWRPYLLRINAVARAMVELEKGLHDRAVHIVNRAIEQIEALEEMDDETFQFEQNRSLIALRELAPQIKQSRPVSQIERLERALKAAIDEQKFERAAELRDEIRSLRKKRTSV